MFMGLDRIGNKIGAVRFDKLNRFAAEINIHLAPLMRGKGYGTLLIKKACDFMKKKGFHVLVARTKKTNVPSIRAFEKNGFLVMFEYCDTRSGQILVFGRHLV